MINITKLVCGGEFGGDAFRYGPRRGAAPVVVWNCTRRCNLKCMHCYSDAGPDAYQDELSRKEARELIEDLAAMDVPVLLFSGGEPLLRPDIFELAAHAREKGIRPVLSTNGTLIGRREASALHASGFAYAGVSLDGMEEVNDRFRGLAGAFEKARRGLRACIEAGLRTGIRITITRHNAGELEAVLDFAFDEGVERFCIYHLVYCGRGSEMGKDDLSRAETRRLMDGIIGKSRDFYAADSAREMLTVDNHADGVYVYLTLREEEGGRAEAALRLLRMAGGNRSGVGIGCVDADGTVFADQFLRLLPLGSVQERRLSELWRDRAGGILSALRERKKLLKGRCGRCRWLDVCNGNMRARALAVHSDLWAEDPACYLTEEELRGQVSTFNKSAESA